MGYPRFFSQNLLTAPAMLTVSSARLGARGAAVAEVLGSGTCYAQGEYSGDLAVEQFVVEVDTAGDLGVATFRWKGGATSIWEANKVATSDSLITLRDGISVRFGGSGFLAGDRWLIEARRTYGRASLLDVDPARVWRATGCILETIAADLGVPTQVATMILARHNLSETATAYLRAAARGDGAALAYDPAAGSLALEHPAGTGANARSGSRTYIDGGLVLTAADGQSAFENDLLRLDPAATNYILKSGPCTGSPWGELYVKVIENAALAPDETMTASKLVADTTNTGDHYSYQEFAGMADDTRHVFAVFAHEGEMPWLRIIVRLKYSSWKNGFFNLATGELGSYTTDGIGMLYVEDGWWLCWVVQDVASGTGKPQIYLSPFWTGDGDAYAGNDSDGIYVWGAQVESGLSPSPYVPTTTAAATRNADAVTWAIGSKLAALVAAGGAGSLSLSWQPLFDAVDGGTDKDILRLTSGQAWLTYSSVGGGTISVTDGTNTASVTGLGWSNGDTLTITVSWGSAGLTLNVDGNSDNDTYAGSFTQDGSLHLAPSIADPMRVSQVLFTFDDPSLSEAVDHEQAVAVSQPNLLAMLDQTYRYWWLVITDPNNPAGDIEAAGLYLGSYTQLSRRMLQGAKDTLGVSRSDQRVDGALRPSPVGPTVNSWSFSYNKLTSEDRTALRAMFQRLNDGQSAPLWFLPDSEDTAGLLYGFLGSSLAFQLSNPARHAVSLEFEESVP
ncbi:MAG: hypothetical protein KKC30_15630 [Proteobacteria bacterium]|nr:hypothetical protein [Pseudomonadota bacterium]MBU4381563.1 hypothetical protein [Pseudomonadota bacterium]MCG2766549.1 hypothetical protein [Desulfarculaceae bacterium]